MSVNWDAVHKLLSISDIAHQWPKLRALNDAAMLELEAHAENAAKDVQAFIEKRTAAAKAAAAEKVKPIENLGPDVKATPDPRLEAEERPVPSFIRRQPIEEQSNGS